MPDVQDLEKLDGLAITLSLSLSLSLCVCVCVYVLKLSHFESPTIQTYVQDWTLIT
jgi:hypothetical protein